MIERNLERGTYLDGKFPAEDGTYLFIGQKRDHLQLHRAYKDPRPELIRFRTQSGGSRIGMGTDIYNSSTAKRFFGLWIKLDLGEANEQWREILIQYAARQVWDAFQKDSWRKTPEYFRESLLDYKARGREHRPYWMPPLLDLTPDEVDLVLSASEVLYG